MAKKRINKISDQKKFQDKVISIFTNSGFMHLKTDREPFDFGGENSFELDNIFVCDNLLIECEDTMHSYELRKAKKADQEDINERMKKHKNNKKKAASYILKNKKEFIKILRTRFSDFDPYKKYEADDYKMYFLYFDYMSDEASKKEIEEYKPLLFVSQATMDYFLTISSSIKKSFKYELFRFLRMKREDYLPVGTAGTSQKLLSPIIYPERWTGYEEGVRVVTFMMQPQMLLELACVLRKDSWDGKDDLYQRLITSKRINEVRNYLVKDKTMFLNNIIVTMPDNISFIDKNRKQISIENIVGTEDQYQVDIPLDYYSMAIIDGQHRVYAFYEDTKTDETEKQIAVQREKHCLLVTGIIYPKTKEWTDEKKRQFESKLFLSINQNSKQVDADTLILVQSILDPTSREGLSRKIIEEMNKHEPFEKKFKMTKMSTAPISISSIVQYALVFLIDTSNKKDKNIEPNKTLYYYWLNKEGKEGDYKFRLEDRDNYVKYCSTSLCEFFKAVHSHFFDEWEDSGSKILKIIGINSFIITYREILPLTNGPQKAKYYEDIMKGWKFHFKDTDKGNFGYSGSTYGKLAKEEIIPWFTEHIPKQ